MKHTEESRRGNVTLLQEFILLGLSNQPDLQMPLFCMFLLIYLITLVGNMLIIIITLEPSLHTPMYFFLRVLSILDILNASVTVPKMLVNFLLEDKGISYTGCAAQMYFLLFLGSSECFLLAAMAYDRYIAICNPLRYMVLMDRRVCFSLVVVSWFCGNIVGLVQTAWVFTLPFCGSNKINYFFCDIPPLIKLSCTDTTLYEMQAMTTTVLVLFIPFCLILVSYIRIITAILKMTSAEGRRKSFFTCSSHLIVVTLYYTSGSLIYLKLKSNYSPDSNKVLALMYTAITPMLNPIIYSLRNKEVKGAVRKLMGSRGERKMFSQEK